MTRRVFSKTNTVAVYRSPDCEPRPIVLAAIPIQNKDNALSVQILFVFEAKNIYSKVPKMLPLKNTCS